ncbi:hypothetical protein ADEAN_000109400 [Angomonas deanei]|uniref:Uncharacterized protein n=1 Tax=Angomonas deanei TaxID=59799 RepID=A0A7G2C3D0_9TRYP|nr:hypothetical protein ADEAN_000109400 [Angomonas deanei]
MGTGSSVEDGGLYGLGDYHLGPLEPDTIGRPNGAQRQPMNTPEKGEKFDLVNFYLNNGPPSSGSISTHSTPARQVSGLSAATSATNYLQAKQSGYRGTSFISSYSTGTNYLEKKGGESTSHGSADAEKLVALGSFLTGGGSNGSDYQAGRVNREPTKRSDAPNPGKSILSGTPTAASKEEEKKNGVRFPTHRNTATTVRKAHSPPPPSVLQAENSSNDSSYSKRESSNKTIAQKVEEGGKRRRQRGRRVSFK